MQQWGIAEQSHSSWLTVPTHNVSQKYTVMLSHQDSVVICYCIKSAYLLRQLFRFHCQPNRKITSKTKQTKTSGWDSYICLRLSFHPMCQFLWFCNGCLESYDKNVCVVISNLNRENWHNQLLMSATSMKLRGGDTDDMFAGLKPTSPMLLAFQRKKYYIFPCIHHLSRILLKIRSLSQDSHTSGCSSRQCDGKWGWTFSTTDKKGSA